MNNIVLITGADGFIGRRTVNALSGDNIVIACVRKLKSVSEFGTKLKVCEINSKTHWGRGLVGVTTVVHLAAVAHANSSDSFYINEVNVKGTLNLARQAAMAGVKRFIFLSSIGVNGASNTSPFLATDTPSPKGSYAISKLEAEIGLKQISAEMGMEVVIIRPPLVYGPEAPGNFGKLVKLVKKNLPLPLGAIHNSRSLVALDNLVDLMVTCVDHPNAANKIFLVSDGYDVSTTQLLRVMFEAIGKKPNLIPVPVALLSFLAGLFGKKAVVQKMCNSLQVDIVSTKEALGWVPPISFKDGILRCFDKE